MSLITKLSTLCAIIIAGLLPLAATPAGAQTLPARVSRLSGSVGYFAGPEQPNNVKVLVLNGELGVTDSAPLVAGTGCRQAGTNFVLCGTNVTNTRLLMGDRDDQVTVENGLSIEILGDDGNDTVKPLRMSGVSAIAFDGGPGLDRMDYTSSDRFVTVTLDNVPNDGRPGDSDNIVADVENVIGSNFSDRITGSSGVNTIDGGNGPDTLSGLGGNDRFVQRAFADGADVVAGGPETDTIEYTARQGAVNVSLDGVANDGAPAPAEGDNIGADVENAVTGSGADTLIGNNAANLFFGFGGDDTLTGKGGNDFLDGGAGVDTYQGNAGNDEIDALDGAGETVNCGFGADEARVDVGANADVTRSCESIVTA